MEGEDDVFFGDTAIDELLSDAVFGAVMLDPDFFVDDVKVYTATIDSLLVQPTNMHELIAMRVRYRE